MPRRGSSSDYDPRGPWLPTPGRLVQDEVRGNEFFDRRRRHQVGIRLSYEAITTLRAAAKVYDVPATTLARILVNRGARAVLEADRHYIENLQELSGIEEEEEEEEPR